MTTPVAEFGTNILDTGPDSVKIVSRKGNTLLFEHAFWQPLVLDDDGDIDTDASTAVDISSWTNWRAGIRDKDASATERDMDVSVGAGTHADNGIVVSFDTDDIQANISANSAKEFYFEIEVNIPTGIDDSNGDEIVATKTVLAGIIELYADIYTVPVST